MSICFSNVIIELWWLHALLQPPATLRDWDRTFYFLILFRLGSIELLPNADELPDKNIFTELF